MMPMAEELLKLPLPRAETGLVREMLSGCQYFDAREISVKLASLRDKVTIHDLVQDLVSSEIPAPRCWLQLTNGTAVLISKPTSGARTDARFHVVFCLRHSSGTLVPLFRNILNNGDESFVKDCAPDFVNNHLRGRATLELCIGMASIVLSTFRAPKTFCHQVTHQPSRQARRSAALAGRPCHKWVEIRLGRSPAEKAVARASGGGSGRGIAWHWRNGHPLNHPNPNQPKWRAGGWVGSPEFGIRSHNYILDPDDGPAG